MNPKLLFGVYGARGRMGKEVIKILKKTPGIRWIACEKKDPPSILSACRVIIDFSSPEALLSGIKTWIKLPKPPILVSGTTGLRPKELRALTLYSKKSPVLHSSNFSIGIALLRQCLEQLGSKLNALEFKSSLRETHHRHKKDAPSGTAILLSSALRQSCLITSIRRGRVIGEHEVIFSTPHETLKFLHVARTRSLFAKGAVAGAIWLAKENKKNPRLRNFVLFDQFLSASSLNKN